MDQRQGQDPFGSSVPNSMSTAALRAQLEASASASAFSTSSLPQSAPANLAPIATEASTTVGNSSLTSVELLMHMQPPQMPPNSAFQPGTSPTNTALMPRVAGGSSGQPKVVSPKVRRRPTGPAFNPHATISAEEIAKHQDPETKPPIGFLTLCIYAINQAPARETGGLEGDGQPAKARMLSLSEVYSWITNTFPYYRHVKNPGQWKNSVRHNLSLSPGFKKVQRSADDPGKGQYWMIELNPPGGDYTPKRIRKKVSRHNSLSPYSHGLRGGASPSSQSGSEYEHNRGRSRSLTHGQTSRETSPVLSPNAFSTSSLNVDRSSGEISVADLTTDRTSPIMANVAPNPPASYLHLPSDPNRMVSRSVDNLQQPSLYHFEPNAQVTNQLTALTADQATLLRPYVDRTRSHSDPLNVAGRRAGWANVLGMVEGSGNQSRRATVPSQHPNMGAHGPIMSTGPDNAQDAIIQNLASINMSANQAVGMDHAQAMHSIYGTHHLREDVFADSGRPWGVTSSLPATSLPLAGLRDVAMGVPTSGPVDLASTGDQVSTAYQRPHQPAGYKAMSPMTQFLTVPTVSVTDDSNNEREASTSFDVENIVEFASAAAAGGTEPALPSFPAGQRVSNDETSIRLQLLRQEQQKQQQQQQLQHQQQRQQQLGHGQFPPPYQQPQATDSTSGGQPGSDVDVLFQDIPELHSISSDTSGLSGMDDIPNLPVAGDFNQQFPLTTSLTDPQLGLNDIDPQFMLNSSGVPGHIPQLDPQTSVAQALQQNPLMQWPQ